VTVSQDVPDRPGLLGRARHAVRPEQIAALVAVIAARASASDEAEPHRVRCGAGPSCVLP
jgi:hypothetical protein